MAQIFAWGFGLALVMHGPAAVAMTYILTSLFVMVLYASA